MSNARWSDALDAAVAAAKSQLTQNWTTVSVGVVGQIQALVSLAKYIDDNRAVISDDEYKMLMEHQKGCLQSVIVGYKEISYTVARNAVASIVNALIKAIPGILGLV